MPDLKKKTTGAERRYSESNTEIRADGDKKKIVGYAAKFNTKSSLIYGMFEETIKPGAFDGADMSDVRAYFNHNRNMILGRTKSGTLRLSIDEVGLRYEIDAADTTATRDLITSMERGDINQSSFAFVVEEDEWDEKAEPVQRSIIRFKTISDVSPVSEPAFPDTSSGVRDLDGFSLETTSKLIEIQEKRTIAALDDARLEIELRTKM